MFFASFAQTISQTHQQNKFTNRRPQKFTRAPKMSWPV